MQKLFIFILLAGVCITTNKAKAQSIDFDATGTVTATGLGTSGRAAWLTNGNITSNNAWLGTNDNSDIPITTNNNSSTTFDPYKQKMLIGKNGHIEIGWDNVHLPNYPQNKLLVENGTIRQAPYDLYSVLAAPDPDGMDGIIKPCDFAIAAVSNADPSASCTGNNIGVLNFIEKSNSHAFSRGSLSLVIGHGDSNNGGFGVLVVGNVDNGNKPTNTGFGGEIVGGGANNNGFHTVIYGYDNGSNYNQGVYAGVSNYADNSTNYGIKTQITEYGIEGVTTGLSANIVGNGSTNTGAEIYITDGNGSNNSGLKVKVIGNTSNSNMGELVDVTGSGTQNMGIQSNAHGQNASNIAVKGQADSSSTLNIGMAGMAGNPDAGAFNFGVAGTAYGIDGTNQGVRGEINQNYSVANSYNIGVAGDVADAGPGGQLYYGVYGLQRNAGHGGNTSVTNCNIPGTCPVDFAGFFEGDVYCSNQYYASDPKLKQNIKNYNGALEQIARLNVKTYTFNNKEYPSLNLPQGGQVGLLSTEVKEIFPSLVKHAMHPPRNKEDKRVDFDVVNYNALIPILIGAVKELNEKPVAENQYKDSLIQQKLTIEELKAQLALQGKQIDELKNLMTDICNFGCAGFSNINDNSTSANVVLHQSIPNPAQQKATIGYRIDIAFKDAYIQVIDNNGKNILRFDDIDRGEGKVTVNTESLAPGVYTYILIIDGKPTASKNMVVTRN